MLARAYLSRVAEPASVAVWLFVDEHGPVEAAARIRRQAGDLPGRVAAATNARHDTADPVADLDTAQRLGIRLVTPESGDWPHFGLAPLEHAARRRALTFEQFPWLHLRRGEPVPPMALWAAGPGELARLGTRSVGIVGARACTGYGQHVAKVLGRGLAEHDVTVVSGGAMGIDRAAHTGALEVGGATVLVSAGGLDRPYPPSNAKLFRDVRASGLLLSERPPGSDPRRHRFLIRNRLIASLSTGTVVVEAARLSGALNTARHCVELGQPLMAVPGPVGARQSAGCHEALRNEEWATVLVTGVEDVLAVVGDGSDLPAAPQDDPDRTEGRSRVNRVLDSLDDRARTVFDGFPAGRAVTTDELVRSCGLSASEVLRSLPALELAGLVESGSDGLRIRG